MKSGKVNVLFVCSRNQWRSPTGERVYRNDDRVNVRSRGTARNAVQTITAKDLSWADVVMVMDPELVNLICSVVDPVVGAMANPTEN